VSVALVVVVLPWLAACGLAVLPAGRIAAQVDLALAGVTALLATALLSQGALIQGALAQGALIQGADALGVLRLDGLAAVFMTLLAVSAVAVRWTCRRRLHRSRGRRSSGQAMLGAMLLACLLTDPLLTWLALAAATAAALFPMLPMAWDRVPLAGGGLVLALFGIVAVHGEPTLSVVAPAGLILGYAMLACVVPDLLILLLALLLRVRDLPGSVVGPMLIGLGLAAVLGCGLRLLLWPSNPERTALLRLGQGGAAVVAFGLGGVAAIFAGLVQVILLTVSGAAADVGGRPGPERVAIAAGLGGLPPFGVFPGLALILIAAAHRSTWLVLPLGTGLAMMGWATVLRLPAPRWVGPVTAAPVWLPLGFVLLIGWLMPESAADWLRATAALAR
jgi:hypothetical protein